MRVRRSGLGAERAGVRSCGRAREAHSRARGWRKSISGSREAGGMADTVGRGRGGALRHTPGFREAAFVCRRLCGLSSVKFWLEGSLAVPGTDCPWGSVSDGLNFEAR